MNAQNIAVLYGGTTAEREVSIMSGQAVIEGLHSLGREVVAVDIGANLIEQITALDVDLVFIALHGGAGEDGRLQALLEMLDLPYTGSAVLASALAMDKVRCKQLWRGIGLPTANFSLVNADTEWREELDRLGGHVMVKPVREGSSIGMSQARSAEEFEKAYLLARKYDDQVMAETWLSGKEYSVAVVGDQALPIIQLEVDEEFYTYNAKYISDTTRYLCPAPVSSDLEARVLELSLEAFRSIGCEGWGRVDLFVDAAGQANLLEVNTVPGLTSHSLVPMAGRQAGFEFPQLLEKIIGEVSRG